MTSSKAATLLPAHLALMIKYCISLLHFVQAKELLCVIADLAMQTDLDFLLFCALIANGCVVCKKGKKAVTYGIAFRSAPFLPSIHPISHCTSEEETKRDLQLGTFCLLLQVLTQK